MAEQNRIDFRLSATDEASAVFRRAQTSLGGIMTAWRSLSGVLAATGLGIAAREITKATIDAERASLKLDAALRSTGHSAGITRAEIEAMAEQAKATTPFDDDEIRKGITALLRFREVQGDVFRDIVKIAPDLASAIDTNLVDAFTRLGRAAQDPATGMRGLREAGVKLSESQTELAKKLQETGNSTAAARIMLEELAKSVGGSSGAENQGIHGASKAAAKAYDDFLKAIGKTETVQSSTKAFFSILAESLNDIKNIVEVGGWMERLNALGVLLTNRTGVINAVGAQRLSAALAAGRPGGPSIEDQARANKAAAAAESERMQAALQAEVDKKTEKLLKDREDEAKRQQIKQKKEEAEAEQKFLEILAQARMKQTQMRDEEAEAQQRRQQEEAELFSTAALARARAQDDAQTEALKKIQDEAELFSTAALARARAQDDAQTEALKKVQDEAKKSEDAIKSLGLSFVSAFEDAAVAGKKLSEVMKGLLQDIIRLTIRKLGTEPLANAFTAIIGSFFPASTPGSDAFFNAWETEFGVGRAIPKFAAGTPFVPRDMLAMVHRGETIIPAGQNRGGDVIFHFNFSGGPPLDPQTFIANVKPALETIARGEIGKQLRNGGVLA